MFQAYLQGSLPEGLALSERLLDMAESRRANRPRAYGLQGRSYCLLDAGQTAQAKESIIQLDELLAADPRFADQALLDDTLGLLPLAEIRTARSQRAGRFAELLMERVTKGSPSNFSFLAAYTAPAEVFLTDWRIRGSDHRLRRQARQALRALGRYARVFPIGRPRLLLWQGVRAGLKGRPSDAVRLLSQSATVAAALGLRQDEGRALLELAEHLGFDTAEGREALSPAETLLGVPVQRRRAA